VDKPGGGRRLRKASPAKAPRGEALQGKLPQGKAPQGKAPRGNAPQGKAPRGAVPQGKAPQTKGAIRHGAANQGATRQGAGRPGLDSQGGAIQGSVILRAVAGSTPVVTMTSAAAMPRCHDNGPPPQWLGSAPRRAQVDPATARRMTARDGSGQRLGGPRWILRLRAG